MNTVRKTEIELFAILHVMTLYTTGHYFDHYEELYRLSNATRPPRRHLRRGALLSRTWGVVKYDRLYAHLQEIYEERAKRLESNKSI